MSNNKGNGGIFSGKGYYIALILCACAIGISGYVFYRSNNASEAASLEEALPQLLLEEETLAPDVPALASEPRGEIPTVPTSQATEPTAATQPKKVLKTVAPLAGQEIFGYSMEALSYNQTTRDWRVHNGMDISAEEGTPVCAAADGVVTAAYEDEAMGWTVTVRHDGGYTTTYASLAQDLAVEAGEEVHMGQVIGCVGSTALLESTLGSHVHFGATFQGSPMDPADFLALGQ